jgi:hypothetical protein
MKAAELRPGDVVAITCGAGIPDTYVQVNGIDSSGALGFFAVGSDLDTLAERPIVNDSDHRSGNGSPIGSWRKLSEAHANDVVTEFRAERAAREA